MYCPDSELTTDDEVLTSIVSLRSSWKEIEITVNGVVLKIVYLHHSLCGAIYFRKIHNDGIKVDFS